MDPGKTVLMGLEGLSRFLRVVEIAHHHRRPRQADLALGAVGNLLLRPVLHDLIVGVREGDADGAFPGDVVRRQAGGGNALRQAVALPHLNGGMVIKEELVEPLLQFHGQAVAAGVDALQANEIRVFHFGQPQQRLIQGGDAGNQVAAVLHQHLGIAARGEPGHQDAAAAADQHGVDGHAQTEAMEHRHHCQHFVTGAEHGVGGDDLFSQSVEVQIRKLDALGDAGGAAGIENHRLIPGSPLCPVRPMVAAAPAQEFVPAQHRRVFGDFGLLAALGEHIAHPDRLG